MPLMPKRVKFRKNQRGVVRGKAAKAKYNGAIKGNALRGNYVAYGDYGLQTLEGGWLSAESIELRSSPSRPRARKLTANGVLAVATPVLLAT